MALLVVRWTNNRKVVGSRPTKVVCITSAVPTVEATEATTSAKIDVAQLKRLVIGLVYKISRYKLATRFADSFEIIAITMQKRSV